MKKTDFEFQYIGNCKVCNTAFQPRSVLVLDRVKSLSEVYAQCSYCKSSFFIYLIKNNKQIVVTPVITDMSKSDISRLQEMSPITEAEVKALDAT